jgi:hypothetical protein
MISFEKRIRRFWAKVSPNGNGCWEWLAAKNAEGYGQYCGKRAHRFAFELAFGPIPEGYEIDHLCQNSSCVNPYHLDVVSHLDHIHRTHARRIPWESCKFGHPFTGDNLILKHGKRRCKACARMKGLLRLHRRAGRLDIVAFIEEHARDTDFWLGPKRIGGRASDRARVYLVEQK